MAPRRLGSLLGGLLRVLSPDAVSLHPVDQSLSADIEVPGSLGLIPVTPLEGLDDELLFDCFQTDTLGRQVNLEGFYARSFAAQKFG